MEIHKQIDKKLEEIYKIFKKDIEDRTGWSLIQRLKKESNKNHALYYHLVSRLFEIALLKGEVINAPKILESLIESSWNSDEVTIDVGEDTSEFKELYPGVYLKAGSLLKTLGFLKLDKTKDFFVNLLVLKNEEINPEIYVGQNLVKRYKDNPSELIKDLIRMFENEYRQKKLSKEPRIKFTGSN